MLLDKDSALALVKWDAEPDFVDHLPVFVDFDESIIDKSSLLSRSGTPVSRGSWLPHRVHRMLRELTAPAQTSRRNISRMIELLRELSPSPRVLIVGGGELGYGTDGLYSHPEIGVVAFDIYGSPNIQLIADAHRIPFDDRTFDGVVVQAVLEHVLEPIQVVSEIARVLKLNGIVYSETPFMQQVHEGPYDFQRFTDSAHRWLFREFMLVSSGPIGGPGTQLIWSLASLVRGIFQSRTLSKLMRVSLFWLRFLDHLVPRRYQVDGATGFYFMGRLNGPPLQPSQIVEYYSGAQ